MDEYSFKLAIGRIFDYYDYKPPSEQRLKMVFQRVRDIPFEAVDYIVESILDELDSPPRNLGKAFTTYYARYSQSPEHVKTLAEPVPCDDCKGEGFIHFKAADPQTGYMYRKVAICGNCENWKRHGTGYKNTGKESPVFPVYNKAYIEKLGMRVM